LTAIVAENFFRRFKERLLLKDDKGNPLNTFNDSS